VLIILLIKGKDLIGFTVAGFSVTFFISEFFTENPYSVKHMGLTNIQTISAVLIILSVLYIITSEKMKLWFSHKLDDKEKGSLKKS
jgi:prolipoprotein diacylglyceryltransferase